MVAGTLPGAATAAAQAAQAQAGAAQLQVLAPRPGTVIVASSAAAAHALRLPGILRFSGAARSLSLRLNGHLVAGTVVRSGQQQVPLNAADGLAVGENLLWAGATPGGAGQPAVVPVRFFAGYRAQGLLSVRLQLGGGTGPAASASIGVPAAGLDRLDASLNGRPVALPAAGPGARRSLDLAQLGSVHFGTNQLWVRVLMTDGAVQTVSRTFVLPGQRDVAVAQVDGAATVGHAVTLNAARSRLVPGSGGLAAARWTLVSRPARSHARLGAATGPRATLRPDVPGHYLIALRVGTGSRSGTDLLDAAATYPEPLVPINTIAYDNASPPNPGIQIGDTFYPDVNLQALQVLVLDRATLGYVVNVSYSANVQSIGYMDAYLRSLPDTDLVIVTHPGAEALPPLPTDVLSQLDTVLGTIGGVLGSEWYFGTSTCWSGSTDYCSQSSAAWKRDGLYGGSFTVIGVPGLAVGQAWRETAAQNRTADGRITGYLTLGVTTATGLANQYTVVPGPDPFVPVDTCAGDGCAVQVGDKAYPAAPGVSGFHVVVLDRTTLMPIADRTVTTAADLDAAITTFASPRPVVWHFINPPPTPFDDQRLVIIQSVGDGKLAGSPSSALLAHIDQLGGTPDYLAASIGGAKRYALVGAATDLPWHATTSMESSTAMGTGTGAGTPTGRISGELQRDRDGLYTPNAGDPVGPANQDLYRILYQPATAWPLADDPALPYIADKISLPAYPDVRSAYLNLNVNFATETALLQGTTCTGYDFCGPDFDTLKAQLLQEFSWVQRVRDFAGNLLSPYQQNGSAPFFDVQEITSEILASIPVPPSQNATMQWLMIMTSVMGIANKAAGPISPEAAAVFGVLAGAGTLATQLMQTSDGGPADAVNSAAGQLAAEMSRQQTAYVEWVDRMETILLSDYGRLQAAGTAAATPAWAWTPSTTIDAITALDAGTRASAYSALLPVAWGGYNLKPGPTLTSSNDVTTYICNQPNDHNPNNYPFSGALPQNQFHAVTAVNTSGQLIQQTWLFASLPDWGLHSAPADVPSTSLTDKIYGSQSTGPDGAYQYAPIWWRTTYDPPGHVTCNSSGNDVNTTWSQHYPPPSISPPPP